MIQKIFGTTNLLVQETFLPHKSKKYSVPKFWVQKYFGQNKFFFKKNVGPQKLRHQKLGPKSLVKIWSVTAEIILIWTNVTQFYMVVV